VNSVDFDCYLVTDRHQTGGRSLETVVRECLAGGVRAVQLREKDLPGRDHFRMAEVLRALTDEFGARLLINDRVDVCMAVGADGVHLRSDSLPVSEVRRVLGPDRLIGYSAHRVSEAVEAERLGADFIVLGPVYDTPSKRALGHPLGWSEIRSAADRVSVPILAIGGMRSDRIADALRHGAHGVAVISALLHAPDAREATEILLRELKTQRAASTTSPF
jgi:thiamine-phosphate pyrophosphorylase